MLMKMFIPLSLVTYISGNLKFRLTHPGNHFNSYLFVVEAEDALEDEDVGAVHRHRLLLPAVRHKVVDRHVNLLAILQSLQKL